VGELSQPVAAAITLRLVDKKKLDLNDDLGSFYTEKVFAGKRFRPANRLFFKFKATPNKIVYVWFNDETTLRKEGAKTDVYVVFCNMLKSNRIPDSIYRYPAKW